MKPTKVPSCDMCAADLVAEGLAPAAQSVITSTAAAASSSERLWRGLFLKWCCQNRTEYAGLAEDIIEIRLKFTSKVQFTVRCRRKNIRLSLLSIVDKLFKVIYMFDIENNLIIYVSLVHISMWQYFNNDNYTWYQNTLWNFKVNKTLKVFILDCYLIWLWRGSIQS